MNWQTKRNGTHSSCSILAATIPKQTIAKYEAYKDVINVACRE